MLLEESLLKPDQWGEGALPLGCGDVFYFMGGVG